LGPSGVKGGQQGPVPYRAQNALAKIIGEAECLERKKKATASVPHTKGIRGSTTCKSAFSSNSPASTRKLQGERLKKK